MVIYAWGGRLPGRDTVSIYGGNHVLQIALGCVLNW
jgi:hypothetical protein